MTDLNSSGNSPFSGPGGIFFLIGFMGCGKTHWGKKWALVNQLSFIDLDEIIEKKAKKTIAEIFETQGEDHFREIEAEALRTCAELRNTIVACGGGVPCFFENMQWMNDHGTTIYIACNPSIIFERVLSEQHLRPLLKKLNETELLFFINQKLKEREPVYKQAKITVQSGELTENIFSDIISVITT